MDFNGNDQDNQNDGRQWDRWNSNASHSSYYNQPTHTPYGQGFAIASLVLGLTSVTIGCCGLCLPLGALGILFALLVRRTGKRLTGIAQAGLILSIIGFVGGIIMYVYTFVTLPVMLQDPVYREQFNAIFRAYTDMDFEEYLEYIRNSYGITYLQ